MAASKSDSSKKRSIVIVGFMAAGKTTIGRRLATRLGMPFLDTDREIERAFGCSVADIFARHGESDFRTAECELISQLLSADALVLSVGGGAFADEQTRKKINAKATSIWIDPPFEVIVSRLASSIERPLASRMSVDELRGLWRERRRSYAEAHFHVEISDASADRAIEQIVQDLK